MLTFRDEDVRRDLAQKTGKDLAIPFLAFPDLQVNLREQVRRIRDHPWLKDVPIHGAIYDVESGRLTAIDGRPVRGGPPAGDDGRGPPARLPSASNRHVAGAGRVRGPGKRALGA